MSAYVVDQKTIERILTWLDGSEGMSSRALLLDAIDVRDPSDLRNEIGKALWRMNVEAVMQRYPDTRDGTDLPGPIEFVPAQIETADFGTELVTTGQAYKSTSCLLYQCSEGDVPETPLYEALRVVERTLAGFLAEDHPEVKVAEWG